jgi:hypothetical protein
MPENLNPQQRSNLVLFFGFVVLLSYDVIGWAVDCRCGNGNVWWDDSWQYITEVLGEKSVLLPVYQQQI